MLYSSVYKPRELDRKLLLVRSEGRIIMHISIWFVLRKKSLVMQSAIRIAVHPTTITLDCWHLDARSGVDSYCDSQRITGLFFQKTDLSCFYLNDDVFYPRQQLTVTICFEQNCRQKKMKVTYPTVRVGVWLTHYHVSFLRSCNCVFYKYFCICINWEVGQSWTCRI